MNQLCWPFCLPLVSDSCSQRLSFFSQKILVILMPSSDWGLELNVSLSTTSFFFLFSSTISFSLFLYAFLHFFLYFAFSFCHYDIVFILSLHFFFINTTSFIPSVDMMCYLFLPRIISPFFHVKHTVQSLENYHAIIPWRDFQLNCSDFFQKNNESGAQARPMSCFLLKWSGANAETHHGFILLTAPWRHCPLALSTQISWPVLVLSSLDPVAFLLLQQVAPSSRQVFLFLLNSG